MTVSVIQMLQQWAWVLLESITTQWERAAPVCKHIFRYGMLCFTLKSESVCFLWHLGMERSYIVFSLLLLQCSFSIMESTQRHMSPTIPDPSFQWACRALRPLGRDVAWAWACVMEPVESCQSMSRLPSTSYLKVNKGNQDWFSTIISLFFHKVDTMSVW